MVYLNSIYESIFVRHGESTLKEVRHQLPETPLSNLGLKQTKIIASRFIHKHVDVILSSTYARTLQTAEEIRKIKPVLLIKSDILVERKMPSLFLGKLINDPGIYPILQSMRKHFYEPGWHYAEEENFNDLIARVKKALDLIISQKKENIIVVTHGYFLTVLIFYIIFGDNLASQSFKYFREHTSISNTGLTLCEYKDNKWKLITLNDYAHLEL